MPCMRLYKYSKIKKSNRLSHRRLQDCIQYRETARVAEDVHLKKGEFRLISLGVGMKLPDGYEAHIAPRSSTYKNFKIMQCNSIGIVDNSYCGANDIWKYPAIAMEDTVIHKNDRICQFRIMKKQPDIHFETVKELEGKSRGGFGSTGKN